MDSENEMKHMSGATTEGTTSEAAASSAPPSCDSLSQLANVELQLVMQFLDSNSLLKLARCSRQTLHCASHPSVWRNHLVDVFMTSTGPRMDPRATARSLVHVRPLRAYLEGSVLISCDTLAAVPNLAAVHFFLARRLMSMSDWQRFLSLPVAQRLIEIELVLLNGFDTIHQLDGLPLLRTLKLQLTVGVQPSLLQPLTHAPSLTHVRISSPPGITSVALLMPLAGCSTLRQLELAGLSHQPRALRLLMERLHQNGGRLTHLRLSGINGDVGKLVLDLFFAARFLPHLETLRLLGKVMDFFPSVLQLPQLQLLHLEPLEEICSDTIEDLLQMKCTCTLLVRIQFDHAQLCTPALSMLAANNPRLQIRFNRTIE
jgi:hypothetical protein